MIRVLTFISLLVSTLTAVGQSTPDATLQLSPQAAYEQALHPLDVVRRSMENWSDSELAAFGVAMKRAAAECVARKPEQFAGDDLISYARLCSLGQKWEVMGAAAALYIDSNDVKKPQLATAYGFKLESELHAQDLIGIVGIHQAMVMSLPYDAVVETVSNEALAFLQLAFTNDALGILASRQPSILAELRSEAPHLPRHALYADGLAKAALEQYAGDPKAAAATVASLDAALGTNLQPDDELRIEVARRQYSLLGKPLPKINYTLSLKDVKEKPHINPDPGAATALLLFPDWCAQCVRMAPTIWDAMGRLGPSDIRVYGLVAEKTPDKAAMLAAQLKPMSPPPADAPPRSPSELLLHTPTLVVPVDALESFAADDFPFLIVVDHAGMVRFAAPATETVLAQGDVLDRVTQHVAEQWPRAKETVRQQR